VRADADAEQEAGPGVCGGAVVLAFILETIGDDMAILFKLDKASLEFLSTSVSAPVIEESLKAAALFFIFLRHPDDFEDVKDGIVYAAMVGIGFTAIENVLYYESAWIRGGNDETFSVFDLRVLTSYSHPLFTAMTGIGLGMIATKGKRLLRPEPLLRTIAR
jgi:RsiW-degrading membrane proteinase PrsW (M82 family)